MGVPRTPPSTLCSALKTLAVKLESVAHIVNACAMHKGLYVAHHDRIVNLIGSAVKEVFSEKVMAQTFTYYGVSGLTALLMCFVTSLIALMLCFLNRGRREVLLLEIGCVYDLYMEMAFNDKIIRYQPILENGRDLGFPCKLVV